jgi:hypothetical protein
MPKYYSPDDQTLIVSSRSVEKGKLSFFTAGAGQGYAMFLFIVSIFIIFGIDALLKYLKAGWRLFNPDRCGWVFAWIILQFALMEFWHILYRTDTSIKRDGTIARSTRVLGFILNTITFEKGHYKFLVEGNYEEVTSSPFDTYQDGTWEAHRMSIVDESGRQFSLFIVKEHDRIKEFEKKFSDFTGFLPDVQVGN